MDHLLTAAILAPDKPEVRLNSRAIKALFVLVKNQSISPSIKEALINAEFAKNN